MQDNRQNCKIEEMIENVQLNINGKVITLQPIPPPPHYTPPYE